ncbi:hypothetical protein NP7_11040 (plasmid) [Moraxella osloensis]|uniref:Integrase catalytic domain-containing protein n=1 Tax=Faucicola osloensis TaxID=34062 RepID=A0A2D2LY11_FAUOS|nr:hypothetical protein NP7_11040 [Moraxella osloensis]
MSPFLSSYIKWINVYNHERPHDSLNDMTPAEFKQVA